MAEISAKKEPPMKKNIAIPFVVFLCLLLSIAASAQITIKNADGKKVKVSVVKGDPPPAGPYAKLTVPIARVIVRDLLNKRELVSTQDSCIACGVPFLETKFYGTTLFETKDLKFSKDKITFTVEQLHREKRTTLSPSIDLKSSDYASVGNTAVWGTGKGFRVGPSILAWKDPADAERFVQAINLLIYEARRASPPADDLAAFTEASRQWREAPVSRPTPPEELTKHRVLAEQAIKDNDLVKALLHYEQGLEIFPTWPEGWFNAALLYEGVREYEAAANRIRRYLILTPDAPDAAAAKEKLIIWEDKARN